jgi:dipeptidyl-peptidase-4
MDSDYSYEYRPPYVVEIDGLRYGFMTCYDFYFYESFAPLALQQVDIIIGCSHQRSDTHEALEIIGKFLAYNTNAYLLRSSISFSEDSPICGSSMAVAPDGTMLGNMRAKIGLLEVEFDPSKKYPVVMLQYSGPTSQRVLNNWRKRFGYALADAGYLVVNVDGRGTGARGRAWRNATYMQLGVKEAEDQISAAQYLQSLPYVDGDRIAICGWSYGGYQTLMCLSKQNNQSPMFKCGIAIAPVTNWRLYDSAYTERFMRRPQVNEFGYEGTDLMQMAGNLTGELLIVHGLADDNVHAQNTLLYTDALVQAGKQFEMQLYVDDNHSIRKPANNEHLHKRIMLFLEKNL